MILYTYGGDLNFKILEELKLKVTPPNEFNDPFEMTPRSKSARDLKGMLDSARNHPDRYRKMCEDMVRESAFKGTVEECVAGLPQAIEYYYKAYRKLSKKDMAQRDLSTVDEVSRNLGVLCLTRLRDSIPMWAYYGNKHQGVVIGLDMDEFERQFPPNRFPGMAGFVRYRKQRVRVNPFLPSESDVSKKQRLNTLLTKSYEWKHEKEFRRVFRLGDLTEIPGKGRRKLHFIDITSRTIKEIIFGCRVSPGLEKRIRRELRRRKKTFEHVRIYRAVRHRSNFELKIVAA